MNDEKQNNLKVSVCIANGNDRGRLMMTLQAIREYQTLPLRRIELVVCDNTPHLPDAKLIREELAGQFKNLMAGTVYVPLERPFCASAAKNAAIAAATGDVILCMDSHVLLKPDALSRLLRFFHLNPDSQDLVTGPLEYTNLVDLSTHLHDEFRGTGWGTAAQAWEAPDGTRFAVQRDGDACRFVQIAPAEKHVTTGTVQDWDDDGNIVGEPQISFVETDWYSADAECHDCPAGLPYTGHKNALLKAGFKMLGSHPDDVIEIPGAYSGLFACRREAWLPFPEGMEGHGGGDFALHQRYRNAGRRVWSLGFLKWWHHFDRQGERPRTPGRTVYNQVRNLLLAGAPRERVSDHFVGNEKLLAETDWQRIVADLGERSERDVRRDSRPAGGTSLPAPAPITRPPIARAIPPGRVGDELFALFDEAGVPRKPACQCSEKRIAMNMLGVEGCRKNREMCIGWLKDSSNKLSLAEKVKAGLGVVKSGFVPNPLDIFGSIFDEGCRRAEAKTESTREKISA